MNAQPSLGSLREYHGQHYVVVARTKRVRRDGTLGTILTWASECEQCGEAFACTTPALAAKFQPNRRCQRHKRPGQRVKVRT